MKNKYIINWELSLACNLDCSFCSQGERRHKNQNILSIKKVFKIISNLPDYIHISFLGGETLVFPGIIDIFKKLEEKKITYEITTNGILIRKYLKNFQELPGLLKINISIDGYGKYHDISRGKKGLFSEIIKVLPLLRTIKQIEVSTVVTSQLTMKNLIQLYYCLQNIGISKIKLIYLMNFGEKEVINSQNKIKSLIISTPSLGSIENKNIYKKSFIYKVLVLKKLEDKMKISIEPETTILNKDFNCKQITKQYRINEKGKLSICEFIENDFGNLFDYKFEENIKNQEYIQLKKEILNKFPLEICKNCCKCYI